MRLVSLVVLTGCADVVVSLGEAPTLGIPNDPGTEPEIQVATVPASCEAPVSDLAFARHATDPARQGGGEGLIGGGLLVADLDGDLAQDLAVTGTGTAAPWRNAGGRLEYDACLEEFDLAMATSVTPVDYDADGDLDLFLTRWDLPPALLRNESGPGWLAFADDTLDAGIGDVSGAVVSTWADVDRDGDLDAFVGGWRTGDTAAQRLYLNDGGRFTRAALPPEADVDAVNSAIWLDVNVDGWPDLYLVRGLDDQTGNVLLRNDYGTLVADHNQHGLDVVADGTGVAAGDLNGDGVEDLVIAEHGALQLRMSHRNWWDEVGLALGLAPDADAGQEDAWGVSIGDVDNDGDLDVAVAFGPTDRGDPDAIVAQPDALFLQQGDGTFVDVAAEIGLADPGITRGLVLADVDGDGWLDAARRDLDGPSSLDVSRCGEAAWLRIALNWSSENAWGVGARVRVVDGEHQWVRTIRAGGEGFASSGPAEVHLGLGDRDTVDLVEIVWPDGRINRLDDVATRQRMIVFRPE